MIKFPWTAKKMKNNTLIFTVDAKAHKPEIKHSAKACDIDRAEVNALIWAGRSPEGTHCNDP